MENSAGGIDAAPREGSPTRLSSDMRASHDSHVWEPEPSVKISEAGSLGGESTPRQTRWELPGFLKRAMSVMPRGAFIRLPFE